MATDYLNDLHKLVHLCADKDLPVYAGDLNMYSHHVNNPFILLDRRNSVLADINILAHEYGHFVDYNNLMPDAENAYIEGKLSDREYKMYSEQKAWTIAEHVLLNMGILHYKSFAAIKRSALDTYEHHNSPDNIRYEVDRRLSYLIHR